MISKPVLGHWQVLRLLIDKAATVKEATELMKTIIVLMALFTSLC